MPTKTFTQFRVDNVVTTLPTTLNYGEEVYYKDSNGNLTLWVGHEDGTAWPAVGYKEYVVRLSGGAGENPTSVVLTDTIGMGASFLRTGSGEYSLASSALSTKNNLQPRSVFFANTAIDDVDEVYIIIDLTSSSPKRVGILHLDGAGSQIDSIDLTFSIRIYP